MSVEVVKFLSVFAANDPIHQTPSHYGHGVVVGADLASEPELAPSWQLPVLFAFVSSVAQERSLAEANRVRALCMEGDCSTGL